MSLFPEKLLITKAIYKLNKYSKAWPNTNLAKTPTLFTVEFQELPEILVLRNVSLQFTGIFSPSHTLRLPKRFFYTKQDFSRALVSHITLYRWPSVLLVFFLNRLTANQKSLIHFIFQLSQKGHIHTYIQPRFC